MSRSTKKTPIVKDNHRGRKFAKRQASKAVRRAKYIPNGKSYRKVYNTWDIYDYRSRCTLAQYMRYEHLWRYHSTKEEMKQAWRRSFYLK